MLLGGEYAACLPHLHRPHKARLAAEMVAAGNSDQSIATRFGGPVGACERHRINHIETPAKAVLQAANRCRDTRAERDRIFAAAAAGNLAPTTYLSLENLTETVRRIESRLERLAQSAEIDDRHLAVAALSRQQLKAAAFAARLGSAGGFVPPKNAPLEVPSAVGVHRVGTGGIGP